MRGVRGGRGRDWGCDESEDEREEGGGGGGGKGICQGGCAVLALYVVLESVVCVGLRSRCGVSGKRASGAWLAYGRRRRSRRL